MKKIAVLLLSLVMVFAFAACDSESDDKTTNVKNNIGAVENSEDTEEEENKVPTPNEKYLLYKETYTKNDNYAIYEYNEMGLVSKKTWYYTNGETMETTYEYTYNEDGSYSAYVVGIGKDIYEYDKNGREIQQFEFYPDGREGDKYALYEWVVVYDEYGRIVDEAKKDTERGGTSRRYLYEYDEAGGLCKKTDKHMNAEYEYKPFSELVK